MAGLEGLFESVDTVSSYETGVDAYGNRYTERWNDLPEAGGTIRQKGNAAYSRTVLEQYTGTTSRPSKNGDVQVDMPSADAPMAPVAAALVSSRLGARVAANRTDMQRPAGPDALEVGRDPTLYHGYNLRHRGVFRNNGREQTRGTYRVERAGTRDVREPRAMVDGTREAPHRVDAVQRRADAGGARVGRATSASAAAVALGGTDALAARGEGARSVAHALHSTAEVTVGGRDAQRAQSARRTTDAPTRRAAAAGAVRVASSDATAVRPDASAPTAYARVAATAAAPSLSQWDSIRVRRRHGAGGDEDDDDDVAGWQSYARAALVAPSDAGVSRSDASWVTRAAVPERVSTQAGLARHTAPRRADARAAHDRPRAQRWRDGARAADGARASARRVGPVRPLSPDRTRLARGVASERGTAPDVRRRPDVAPRVGAPDVAGRAATVAGAPHVNADESARSLVATAAARLAAVAQLIRASVVGGAARETRESQARTGNLEGVVAAAPRAEDTRRLVDDVVTQAAPPLPTGREAHAVVGAPPHMTTQRDASAMLADEDGATRLRVPSSAAGTTTTVRPHTTSLQSRSERGLGLVDPANMQRSVRVF